MLDFPFHPNVPTYSLSPWTITSNAGCMYQQCCISNCTLTSLLIPCHHGYNTARKYQRCNIFPCSSLQMPLFHIMVDYYDQCSLYVPTMLHFPLHAYLFLVTMDTIQLVSINDVKIFHCTFLRMPLFLPHHGGLL